MDEEQLRLDVRESWSATPPFLRDHNARCLRADFDAGFYRLETYATEMRRLSSASDEEMASYARRAHDDTPAARERREERERTRYLMAQDIAAGIGRAGDPHMRRLVDRCRPRQSHGRPMRSQRRHVAATRRAAARSPDRPPDDPERPPRPRRLVDVAAEAGLEAAELRALIRAAIRQQRLEAAP